MTRCKRGVLLLFICPGVLRYLRLAILCLGALAYLPAAGFPAPEAGPPGQEPADRDSLVEMSAAQVRAALLHDRFETASRAAVGERSVLLALGMSAAVPGLGQAYNRDWIRAAVAAAVEGGLVVAYVLWKERGLDAEEDYQQYAHRYWNPARYAGWLNDYVDYLEQTDGAEIGADAISIPEDIDFTAPDSWSAQERQSVRSLFTDVRAVEDVVYHPETDAGFSHNLPFFGEQQYYELIGKYFQFAPGWRDYPDWTEDGAFTDAIDPERTGPDGSKPNVQGRFLQYAEDHSDANTLLRRASRVSAFLVLNHIVAALDAAISAKLHNDRVDANLGIGPDRFNHPSLSAELTWRW